MLDLITTLSIIYSVTALILVAVFWDFKYGAMWMPLPKKQVQKMLEVGQVGQGKKVFDLGCGFGSIGFAAARLGADVTGIEADRFKASVAKWRAKRLGLNVKIMQGNLLDADLSEADILLCYLSDSLMKKVGEKRLKNGCLIVSCSHEIKRWTPKAVYKEGIYVTYLYHVNDVPTTLPYGYR